MVVGTRRITTAKGKDEEEEHPGFLGCYTGTSFRLIAAPSSSGSSIQKLSELP